MIEYFDYLKSHIMEGMEAEKELPSTESFCHLPVVAKQVNELKKIFKEFPKMKKIMILDPELGAPLDRIMTYSEFKANGIEAIHPLEGPSIQYQEYHFIYLLRPTSENVKKIVELFTKGKSGKDLISYFYALPDDKNKHTIYFVNKPTLIHNSILEREGVIGKISRIGCYELNLIPLAKDLLSMECRNTLKSLLCDSDSMPLFDLANSIKRLEQIYGKIPHKQANGKYSEKVIGILNDAQPSKDTQYAFPSKFSRLTLIDRTSDLITPCLTPGTFEGLIDEFFGIKCGKIQIKNDSKSGYASIDLEKDNNIYEQIRDSHIDMVKPLLREFVDIMVDKRTKTHKLLEADLKPGSADEIMSLVNEVDSEKRQAFIALNLEEEIMRNLQTKEYSTFYNCEQNILYGTDAKKSLNHIKDLIEGKQPINQILRLICLYSQIHGELGEHCFEEIMDANLRNYGRYYGAMFMQLKELGMLSPTNFLQRIDSMQLFENFNVMDPKSMSYTYNGYTPFSCRLIENLLAKPVKKAQEGLELVCFVGGCTSAEVSALRLLSKKIVVLTTNMINGNAFMENLKTK